MVVRICRRLAEIKCYRNFEGYYDCIITNVKKAVNIVGSQAMIFYDIPTNPQITYQIMGRIDRNNFDEKRTYHFLVYLNSPEMYKHAGIGTFQRGTQ